MKRPGLSIAELIIVIAIIMVLAATTIGSIGTISRNLRFGNAFNKIVFMVQQARSSALTAKGNQEKFGFSMNMAENKAELFSESGGNRTVLETTVFASEVGILQYAADATQAPFPCANTAAVMFDRSSAKVTLVCDGREPPALMRFGLKESNNVGADAREKFFTIHRGSGIPQVQ